MKNKNFEQLHAVKTLKKILEKWWGLQINFLDCKGQVTTAPKGSLFVTTNKGCTKITENNASLVGCVRSLKKQCSKDKGTCHAGFSTLSIPIKNKKEHLGYIFCNGFVQEKTKKNQLLEIKKFLQNLPHPPKDLEDYLDSVPVISDSNLKMIKLMLSEMTEEILFYQNEREFAQEKIEHLEQDLGKRFEFSNIIGKAKSMQNIYQIIEQVKDSTSTILILGEHGTGKELIARALHHRSSRKEEAFVALNCGALSETIIESELFGHKQGSFTGATKDRKGFFEVANKGTLFLDEIGEMPLSMQVKLLRVLQDRTFIPVGSNQEKKTNARIVCATNKNLETLCKEGKFREDLFYRINVINIQIPPLRKRAEDIPLLIEYFIEKNSKLSPSGKKTISKKTLKALLGYSWPGNIRELENEIERLYVLSEKDTLDVELLSEKIK
jgi:two-component system, NtrC family, response regulator HupR/HoxA